MLPGDFSNVTCPASLPQVRFVKQLLVFDTNPSYMCVPGFSYKNAQACTVPASPGQVQGVGYRWSARSQARYLGIHGFVKNLTDGSVYIEAEGKDEHPQDEDGHPQQHAPERLAATRDLARLELPISDVD